MRGLLRELSPGAVTYNATPALEREATERLKNEQLQLIRRAPHASEAIKHLAPLAKLSGSVEGYGVRDFKAAYPKEALALAWARARHLGELDEEANTVGHDDYFIAGSRGKSVHSALISMARASGHADLAEAFAATGERHGLSKRDDDLMEAVTRGPEYEVPSTRTLAHIKAAAQRMGIMDKTIGELSAQKVKLGGKFAPSNNYYTYGRENRNNMKFSEVLDKLGEERRGMDDRAAQKEAA